MGVSFDSITVVGVGLLGASLGLAAKRGGIAKKVIGIGRRQKSLDAALGNGSIDEASLELHAEAAQSDLVVICTPAATVAGYLDQLKQWAGAKTVITDVASTKGEICAHAKALWPEGSRFVGSHPMAGSEKWGPEHADIELYNGAVTFVEQGDHLDPEAHALVRGLWEALGSRVVTIGPAEHDVLVAATSHLPHIMASALAQILPEGDGVRAAVGAGFRDTTRVAEGRPELWRDIALTNRVAIGGVLNEMHRHLRRISEALASQDGEALESFFEEGLKARRRALDE